MIDPLIIAALAGALGSRLCAYVLDRFRKRNLVKYVRAEKPVSGKDAQTVLTFDKSHTELAAQVEAMGYSKADA